MPSWRRVRLPGEPRSPPPHPRPAGSELNVAPSSPLAPIEGHVPVEHRFLGLDRRTTPLALVLVAIAAVFLVVVPSIDRAVGWDDAIEAGDVIDLGDGVTFVPPEGW